MSSLIKTAAMALTSLSVGVLVLSSFGQAQEIYRPYYADREKLQTIPSVNVVTTKANGVKQIEQVPGDAGENRHANDMSTASLPIGTITGVDGGPQILDYVFTERNPNAENRGVKVGADLDAYKSFANHFFMGTELDFNYGSVDYKNSTASSSSKSHDDYAAEARFLGGYDIVMNDRFALSPYSGFGYRYHENDNRGLISNGAQGLRSENEYYYIPIGVKPQMRVDGASKVTLGMEYDYVVKGMETAHLGDATAGDPRIDFQQNNGYGLKASLMYERQNLIVGPFVNYWHFASSKQKSFISPASSCGSAVCTESQAAYHSVEAGMKLKYRFMTE